MSTDRLAKGTFHAAIEAATAQEAMLMVKHVGEAFKNQGLHRRWTKLSPVTLALRKKSGFGGTKILQVSNTLRRSVGAKKIKGGWFVGVHRSARTAKGKKLVNIARVHEGPFPTLVPVTTKMRRFWMAMFLQGIVKAPLKKSRKVLVIWPRPFLRPAFLKTKEGSKKRMTARIKAYLRSRGIRM
jgi:hypothetical protein